MARIQPISTFYNGETKELTNFVLRSTGDNFSLEPMKGAATLYYELQSVTVAEDGTETCESIITANLPISGADYDNWNADPTSNAWAYKWAAQKLNLTFIEVPTQKVEDTPELEVPVIEAPVAEALVDAEPAVEPEN